MRILQISSARTLGGGERHVADLTRALLSRGHEVYAALAPTSPLVAELAALPAENIITLPLRNALDLASARALARLVRREEIQIIHAHVGRDYPLAAFARRRARAARLVITRHVLFPLGRINSLILRDASRVVAVSEAVARALRARRVVSADKITVIPNGINFDSLEAALRGFEREAYRRSLAPDTRFLVGTVGELSVVKGQEVFVRAAARVADSVQGVEFLIVGEDTTRGGETRARLESLITSLGLGGRVRLTGRREDVARILSSLDVFVSASRSEAFGLAIVEAMACGAAIVATATEGAREIVSDGATGRLVAVDDEAALADTIISLLDDARARARLGQRGRDEARERFSLARMVEATERVYREALEA